MKQLKFLLAITTLSFAIQANAVAGNPFIKSGDVPIELKWIGNIENQPAFSLIFDEANSNIDYKVLVKDNTGYVFFYDVLNNKEKRKIFLLNANDLQNATVSFEITSKETGKSVTYEVKLQQTQNQQLSIVRLK
jgi:hypothetical protein